MANWEFYVGEMMAKLMTHQTEGISRTTFTPQKPAFPQESIDETKLERCTPESVGVLSGEVLSLEEKLAASSKAQIQKFMMLRHGKVIAEVGYTPYDLDLWHVTHSMCKSITGMAIGLLVHEGKLKTSDTLRDIFPERYTMMNFNTLLKKDITVWDLLTMSSGAAFNETGAISGDNWIQSFIESNQNFVPGTQFDYNSMNSYMLSAIVTRITGITMFDYLKEHLFKPLGISRIFWETSPEGITKGGWGLFMRIEDMAKLGVLYLQEGIWDDKQIIPKTWVEESTYPQIETGLEKSPQYGLHIWINSERPGAFAFNGMLGQNVYCYKDIDMVVVTNAGNSEIFQKGEMHGIIAEAMENITISDTPLSGSGDTSKLRAFENSQSGNTFWPFLLREQWRQKREIDRSRTQFKWLNNLNDVYYDLDIKGVGIFPLMAQVMHNNFTDGISKIGFKDTKDGSFTIEIVEGEEVHSLKCSFGNTYSLNTISLHGEEYIVKMHTIATTDEYDRFVLRNEIVFPEEATMRIFNIYFYDHDDDVVPDKIEIRMDELPGSEVLLSTLGKVTTEGWFTTMVKGYLQNSGAIDVLYRTAQSTICPRMFGKLIKEE